MWPISCTVYQSLASMNLGLHREWSAVVSYSVATGLITCAKMMPMTLCVNLRSPESQNKHGVELGQGRFEVPIGTRREVASDYTMKGSCICLHVYK